MSHYVLVGLQEKSLALVLFRLQWNGQSRNWSDLWRFGVLPSDSPMSCKTKFHAFFLYPYLHKSKINGSLTNFILHFSFCLIKALCQLSFFLSWSLCSTKAIGQGSQLRRQLNDSKTEIHPKPHPYALPPLSYNQDQNLNQTIQPFLTHRPRVLKPIPKRFARGFHNPSWLAIRGALTWPQENLPRGFSLRSLRTISVSPPLSPVSGRIPVPRSVGCLDTGYDGGYQQPQTGHHQPPPHPCTAP